MTFEPGTASLSGDAYVVIETIAALLQAETSIGTVELLARARRDEVERASDVDHLARERGELVARALVERGVAAERLAVIVIGAREPAGEPIDRSVSFRMADAAPVPPEVVPPPEAERTWQEHCGPRPPPGYAWGEGPFER